MGWLDALGWAGSVLLIVSLLQARVLRFRILNTIASLTLTVFNAILGIWPMVAMNAVLAGINVFFIWRLVGQRHDTRAYQVLAVGPRDAYLHHLLARHHDDIAKHQPDFSWDDPSGRLAYLVVHRDEAVGIVVLHDAGDGVAQVDLDYVTPRFRDFTPGEFVFGSSGLFADLGFTTVRTPPGMAEPYYHRLGFVPQGEAYVKTVA